MPDNPRTLGIIGLVLLFISYIVNYSCFHSELHSELQKQLIFFSDRTSPFNCNSCNRYHSAVDFSGIMGALLHTAHTGNALFGICRKCYGINRLHRAVFRTNAAFHTIFGRLRHKSRTARFFIRTVARNRNR